MSQIVYRSPQSRFDLIKIYKEIWAYRSFLLNWTKRELEIRYKGSFLGIIWSFFNPLLSLIVYFFVFSRITNIQIPNYLVFLFSGMICWFFFVQVVTRATSLMNDSSSILKKVYFPQEILIISIIISGAINFLISFGLVLLMMLITKAPFTLHIFWVPIILALQCLFLYSTSLLLTSIGAILKDLSPIIPTLLSLMFFVTPIVYSVEAISKKYAWILNSQPIANLISLYRDVIHIGVHPDWILLIYCFVFNIVWYLFCHWVFHRLRFIVYDLS